MGWLTSRNSSVVRCADCAFSEEVRTTMPSVTTVLHAICSLGAFSTSTRHMRQLPSTGRSGCQQKCGTSLPSCNAAWITVVPGATSISLPSIVHLGMFLSVQLAGDHVEAADDGHRVGQQPALDHVGVGLVDVVAGRAHLHPPGMFLAGADDVVAELAVGALGVAVHLARRGQDALVDELEVVHQGFDG